MTSSLSTDPASSRSPPPDGVRERYGETRTRTGPDGVPGRGTDAERERYGETRTRTGPDGVPGRGTDAERERYGETRTRTGDTTIFSRVLYQLSYLAERQEG